jgi:hypothetical protein
MTPKEKAQELWLSYYELIDDCYSDKAAKLIAKQFVLIVVDEIMKAVGWEKMELGVDRDNYWTEVKQEIENL